VLPKGLARAASGRLEAEVLRGSGETGPRAPIALQKAALAGSIPKRPRGRIHVSRVVVIDANRSTARRFWL